MPDNPWSTRFAVRDYLIWGLFVVGCVVGHALARLRVLIASVGFAIATLCGATQTSAQSSNFFFQKNGWTGAIIMNNQAPAGCGVFTDVSQTVRFAMTADRNGTWRAVFDRPAANGRAAGFHRNLKWEMELLVDGKSIHRGTAVVGANGISVVNPPLNPVAMQALSLGHSLEVVTVRGRFQYSLSGSADAIEAATKCVSVLNSPPPQVSTGSIDQRPVGPTSGTGLFVNSDGDILTNSHVVRGCLRVSGGIPGSQMQNALVVARDHTNDLALLKSNFKPSMAPVLRTGVRTGEPVAVYGFPLAGLLPSTGNFTLGNVTATAGLRDDTSMLQVRARASWQQRWPRPGSSRPSGGYRRREAQHGAYGQGDRRYSAERQLRHQDVDCSQFPRSQWRASGEQQHHLATSESARPGRSSQDFYCVRLLSPLKAIGGGFQPRLGPATAPGFPRTDVGSASI